MKVAIVVGEASGDILAARLIKALRTQHPDCEFIGVTGPEMLEAGCQSLSHYDPLAIMGIFEVLRHIPSLLKFRRELREQILTFKPDVFIGIDAPDFNLGLERQLKEQGIKTVHYVSPSVWAWRQGRIKNIKRSVDHMLALLPFEAKFYQDAKIPVTFVGHPLADEIVFDVDNTAAKTMLGLPEDKKIVAILPGSRSGEIKQLAKFFIEAAAILSEKFENLHFVLPVAREKLCPQIESLINQLPTKLAISLIDGNSRRVLESADIALVASGTATLETMLVGRPMVVAYKVSWLTYRLLKWTGVVKTPAFSLPNLLTKIKHVPEVIQDDITAEKLADELSVFLTDEAKCATVKSAFKEAHGTLKLNASEQAANAVLKVAHG